MTNGHSEVENNAKLQMGKTAIVDQELDSLLQIIELVDDNLREVVAQAFAQPREAEELLRQESFARHKLMRQQQLQQDFERERELGKRLSKVHDLMFTVRQYSNDRELEMHTATANNNHMIDATNKHNKTTSDTVDK